MANTANTGNLSTVNIDFGSLKQSFQTYLSQQPYFKDWNFEGSNLSVLMDLLTYNTTLNALYLNMVSNERFLDSAQLRESIVSHAKSLNYCPRSRASAAVEATVSLNGNNIPGVVTLPTGFAIAGQRAGNSALNFITSNPVVLSSGNDWTANVMFYEGRIITETFNAPTQANSVALFNIQSANIDTTSIAVTVQGMTNTTPVQWSRSTGIVGAGPQSNIWFLQGYMDNYYQVAFGDGNIGASLNPGDVVTIAYRETSGPAGNGLNVFSPVSGIANQGSSSPITVSIASNGNQSYGGADRESNTSIQLAAPRYYQSQTGASSANNYDVLIQNYFPQFTSVQAYGGEDAFPQKKYGSVIVSAKMAGSDTVPASIADQVVSYIQPFAPLGITVVFAQPDVYNLNVDCTVHYDPTATANSSTDIQNGVVSAILGFDSDNLEVFGSGFWSAQVTNLISAVDASIKGVDLVISLSKTIQATGTTLPATSINYNNAIVYPFTSSAGYANNYHPVVTSAPIVVSGNTYVVYDDGAGNMRMGAGNIANNAEPVVGTINYQAGTIAMNPINGVFSFSNMVLTAYMASDDVRVTNQQILSILPTDVTVSVLPV